MKRIAHIMIALGILMGLAGAARAVNPANLLIKVTPNGTKSLTLSTGTYVWSPALDVNSTDNVSPSSVTVTNDGTGPITIGLRISDKAGTVWTSGASAGDNIFNLRAIFNGNTPPLAAEFASSADDVLDQGGAVLCTTEGGGSVYTDGTETGVLVPPVGTNTRGLWFKLDMPTTSTVATEQSWTVEVSAN